RARSPVSGGNANARQDPAIAFRRCSGLHAFRTEAVDLAGVLGPGLTVVDVYQALVIGDTGYRHGSEEAFETRVVGGVLDDVGARIIVRVGSAAAAGVEGEPRAFSVLRSVATHVTVCRDVEPDVIARLGGQFED